MSSRIQSFIQLIRRKLGKPEVSILVMGDNNPSTRNRVKLLNTYLDSNDFLWDDSLHDLPIDERFKFKPNLFQPFEGILYFIDATNENMIKHERIFFWEKLMWNDNLKGKPIAICAYNSNLQGSLTRGELIENLSLIRITDRNWQLFETPEIDDVIDAMNWLKELIWMLGPIDWEIKEELMEKLAQKRVVIVEAEDEEIHNSQDSDNN